jgi:hypothetical protein
LRKFRVSEISYPINGESCLKYLLVANRCFKFLLSNESKSGFYFVDWRINFSALYSYLTENDFIERSDDTKTFIRYFEQSPEILYSRLGIFEDDTDL